MTFGGVSCFFREVKELWRVLEKIMRSELHHSEKFVAPNNTGSHSSSNKLIAERRVDTDCQVVPMGGWGLPKAFLQV